MRKMLAIPLVVLTLVLGTAGPAAAATKVIVLPGATSAEGLADAGDGTFYTGDLLTTIGGGSRPGAPKASFSISVRA